jgi:hypothetical protein
MKNKDVLNDPRFEVLSQTGHIHVEKFSSLLKMLENDRQQANGRDLHWYVSYGEGLVVYYERTDDEILAKKIEEEKQELRNLHFHFERLRELENGVKQEKLTENKSEKLSFFKRLFGAKSNG